MVEDVAMHEYRPSCKIGEPGSDSDRSESWNDRNILMTAERDRGSVHLYDLKRIHVNVKWMILIGVVGDEPLFDRAERARPFADGRIPGVTIDRESAEFALRHGIILTQRDCSMKLVRH